MGKKYISDHFNKLRNLRNFLLKLGYMGGVRVLHPKWQWDINTVALGMAAAIFKILSFYTLWKFHNNFFKVIETMCTYGVTVTVKI